LTRVGSIQIGCRYPWTLTTGPIRNPLCGLISWAAERSQVGNYYSADKALPLPTKCHHHHRWRRNCQCSLGHDLCVDLAKGGD